MARYTGPVCRQCRRAGQKLFIKGERCLTPKCAIERRRSTPGEQPTRRRRLSEWGTQLREKQKARQMYGVLEKQFRKHYDEAKRRTGLTGENLLQILESRLDNTVYRLGFADSRAQARQLVRHGHISVDGRKTNIPSYLVQPGQVLAWTERGQRSEYYSIVTQEIQKRTPASWVTLDPSAMQGKVVGLPERSEIDSRIDERLIVEFYSR
ncbi:MAG: 30S ribosomal protein S4 [SAR202 cluster bacterium]|nr:30S ribosomal protein S4 [SAR202 cluster bacterium]